MSAELRIRQWHERHAAWGCPSTTDHGCNPCQWPGSAEWARRNGWGPGTVLEGDEGTSRVRITLLFIGKEAVMARWPRGHELSTHLGSRVWRKVGEEDT